MMKSQGSALLLVLMITAIMTSVMLLMMSQNNYHMKMSHLVKTQAQERLNLYSIQSKLNFDIMTSNIHIYGPKGTNNKTTDLESFQGERFDYLDASVSISDKSGLVSLRPFNKEVFVKLLRTLGAEKDHVTEIVDRFEDWQDPDGIARFRGGERGSYDEPFLPSNNDIVAKEELNYIFDGHSELLKKVLPYLSMYAVKDINHSYISKQLQKQLYQGKSGSDILPQPAPRGEFTEDEGGGSYSSGKYYIVIHSTADGFNISREYELIRGLGTYKPFYIVNEVYR